MPGPTQGPRRAVRSGFAYGAVTRCGPTFQSVRLAFSSSWRRSYNTARRIATPAVWALPRSLATTYGISFDVSSSPYLDVSVQAVPHVHLFDSMHVTGVLLQWVSPFGNLRIIGYLLLPEAYRSLSRLSSAPSAKAFTLRPF